MAIRIRLSRGGAKKRPYYRIVIADSRSPRDGRFIERVGTYNPMVPKDHPERMTLKEDRIRHWLGHGARPTDRVARFLGQADIIQLPERPEQTKQHLPRAKTLERIKEAEEAAAAAAAPPPEESPAEEASAEEAPAEEAAPAETPAEEASTNETPAEEVAPEEAPAEEVAAEEAPAEEAPAEEAPAEAAPADEAPAAESGAADGDEEKKD